MVTLSKIFLIFLLLFVQIDGAYIRKVYVGDNASLLIKEKLIEQFQGTITNRDQIELFILKMKLDGIYRQIEYKLLNVKNGFDLYFDLKFNQKITRINFINLPFLDSNLTPLLKNKIGGYFNYQFLTADIDTINIQLAQKGFFLSSVRSIEISDQGQLNVTIESPRVIEVDFFGLESTPKWYANRDLMLQKGQVVNQDVLDLDFETLQSLPLFSTIMPPEIHYITSENVLITYKVKKRKQNRLDIGIEELENNQGLALFAKIKRYNNLLFSDFIELQTQLSYLNMVDVRSYQLRYKQPWLLNLYPVSLDINVYAKYRSEVLQENLEIYNTIRTGSSLFFAKQFRQSKITLGSGLKFEQVAPQTENAFESYNIHSFSLFFEQNKIKTFVNPKAGFRFKAMYDLGGDVWGLNLGGITFSRFSLMHSRYYSLFRSQVFAFRAFGGVYNKQSSTTTFETEKFSLGGANSLRGYREFFKYGNYRLSMNLEQRFPINQNILGVLFYDSGFIDDTFDDLFNDYYYGYGFGFRWLNTFMPIRLDFAKGNEFMIHLGLSQTF